MIEDGGFILKMHCFFKKNQYLCPPFFRKNF